MVTDVCISSGLLVSFTEVQVPVEYNILPPAVTCLTRLWHPNISEDGEICLLLLRPHSMHGLGWAPTR